MGLRYEQQAPIGNYTVDFWLATEEIVIEADGVYGHLSKADEKRDAELLELGVEKVIHIRATTQQDVRETLENELKCQE